VAQNELDSLLLYIVVCPALLGYVDGHVYLCCFSTCHHHHHQLWASTLHSTLTWLNAQLCSPYRDFDFSVRRWPSPRTSRETRCTCPVPESTPTLNVHWSGRPICRQFHLLPSLYGCHSVIGGATSLPAMLGLV